MVDLLHASKLGKYYCITCSYNYYFIYDPLRFAKYSYMRERREINEQ